MKGRSSSRVSSSAAATAASAVSGASTSSIITAVSRAGTTTGNSTTCVAAAASVGGANSTNQQADQGTNVENGREATTPAQMSPQVITQPSTPRTPTSPSEHTPNPPTPGTTNSNNSNNLVDTSPQYVTITADGPAASRTYASLASVSSAVVDGETVTGETVPESAAYVTYVDSSGADHTLYAAAAAAAAAASANGQTMSYPVYTVGDSTTTAIYSPGGSATQYYTTSASTPTVAYSQESGVTYLVPSTSNNSISLEAADGQHNISHATRVSPATTSSMKTSTSSSLRNKSVGNPPPKLQHINYPPAKIRRIESFNCGRQLKLLQQQQQEDDDDDEEEEDDDEDNDDDENYPIPPPVVVTLESSSAESDLEDSSEDDRGGGGGRSGGDLGLSQFVQNGRIKRLIATAGSGRTSLEQERISDGGATSSSSSSSARRAKEMDIIPFHLDLGSSFNGTSTIAKFCPVTVQWLLENYETAEGVSLPRSTLYYHYLRHCKDHNLDPVNAASFGKLIRSVFLGLRTRRLGTRGNSKYHYYGIRLKPSSPLVNVTENGEMQSMNSQSAQSSPNSNQGAGGGGGGGGGGGQQHHEGVMEPRGCNAAAATHTASANGVAKRMKISKGDHYDVGHGAGVNLGDPFTIQQFLGDPSGALDNLPELDLKINVPEGLSMDDVIIFRTLYREHCESLLDCLANFQLSQIESYWRNFWRNATLPDNAEMEYEKLLPKSKLVMLCTVKEVQEYIRETDFQFYQNVVGILVPNVLRPIPSAMTQAIRNFAKTLESWMSGAVAGYPTEVVTLKLSSVNALAQTLRRYTSLNHLAQAARAVLQNQNQIAQMLTDLNRVDFHNVEEQASWVCGCLGDMVPNLEQDFKATLAQQQTLEQWATWLEGVVDRILRPHSSSARFVQAARQFLLKWSFYSSLVIRDLTLRSAASFGSFHLLRLLYDEYMFYLVEHRVAQVTGIVPIAVIGKKSIDGMNLALTNHTDDDDLENGDGEERDQKFLMDPRRNPMAGTNGDRSGMNGSEESSSPPDMSSSVNQSDRGTHLLLANNTAPNKVNSVTSTANVNVHQISSHAGVVVKAELKRVKNFLTV